MATLTGGKHLKEARKAVNFAIRASGKHLKEQRAAWIAYPWRAASYGGSVSFRARR